MITANVAPTAKMLTQPVISNTAAIAGSVFPRASDASNSRMINIWNKLVAVGNGEAREALDVGDPLSSPAFAVGDLPGFVQAGLPSGRLTSSNVATLVLSIQDSIPRRRFHRIHGHYAASSKLPRGAYIQRRIAPNKRCFHSRREYWARLSPCSAARRYHIAASV